MGVLKQPSRLIDEITLDDYILEDDSDDDDEVEVDNDANNNSIIFREIPDDSDIRQLGWTPRRRRQRCGRMGKKARQFTNMTGDMATIKMGRMGARKQRRYENARLLYSLADPDDICEDYSDILQSTVTAMSKLFIEKENMEVWNAFIEKDEEEQREFLESLGAEEVHQQCCSYEDPSPRGTGIFEYQTHRDHPVYSAEISFSRLNRRLRMFLRHKALPLEFMAVSEEEMREFFHKNVPPTSEWSTPVLPRLHRLIVHALSQYLLLISKSILVGSARGGDEKVVKVRNKYCSFRPPSETLVDYLKRMRRIDHGKNTLS